MATGSDTESLAIFLGLVVLLLARRTVRQLRGTVYSAGRLFVAAGLYVLLFAVLGGGTLYTAVGTWGTSALLLAPFYLGVPLLAAAVTAPYIRRIVKFETRADGRRYYRLSWHVPVLYLVLFAVRLAAEAAVFGPSGLTAFPPPAPPSILGLYLLVAVDLLFGVSLGLLLGRGAGVYLAHRELPALPSAAAAAQPLPSTGRP